MTNYLDNIVTQQTPFGTIYKVCTWANGERGTISIHDNAAYFNDRIIALGFTPYYILYRIGRSTETMFGINVEREEQNARTMADEYYKSCLQSFLKLHEDDDEAILYKSGQDYLDKLESDFPTLHHATEQSYLENCELFDYISEEEAEKIRNRTNIYLQYIKHKNKSKDNSCEQYEDSHENKKHGGRHNEVCSFVDKESENDVINWMKSLLDEDPSNKGSIIRYTFRTLQKCKIITGGGQSAYLRFIRAKINHEWGTSSSLEELANNDDMVNKYVKSWKNFISNKNK